MKLELKHLAPYLPYDLEFYVQHANGTRLNNWCMTIDTDLRAVLEQQNKPILRPLSDLTKEINMDGDMVSAYEILPRREKEDYKNPIIGYWSWNAMLILFEYHFDVFGLIEKGLAIDINTLNN